MRGRASRIPHRRSKEALRQADFELLGFQNHLQHVHWLLNRLSADYRRCESSFIRAIVFQVACPTFPKAAEGDGALSLSTTRGANVTCFPLKV